MNNFVRVKSTKGGAADVAGEEERWSGDVWSVATQTYRVTLGAVGFTLGDGGANLNRITIKPILILLPYTQSVVTPSGCRQAREFVQLLGLYILLIELVTRPIKLSRSIQLCTDDIIDKWATLIQLLNTSPAGFNDRLYSMCIKHWKVDNLAGAWLSKYSWLHNKDHDYIMLLRWKQLLHAYPTTVSTLKTDIWNITRLHSVYLNWKYIGFNYYPRVQTYLQWLVKLSAANEGNRVLYMQLSTNWW